MLTYDALKALADVPVQSDIVPIPQADLKALVAIVAAADRVAFETSENQPGSHDWHLINNLRLLVADLDVPSMRD